MEDYISFSVPGFKPEYFYRVSLFMTTFGADPGKNQPFSHQEDFKGDDLIACRSAAYEFYQQHYNGLDNNRYHLPFASPAEFQLGQHSAVSIILFLVEVNSDGAEIEWALEGENEGEMDECRELELAVLQEKGYITL